MVLQSHMKTMSSQTAIACKLRSWKKAILGVFLSFFVIGMTVRLLFVRSSPYPVTLKYIPETWVTTKSVQDTYFPWEKTDLKHVPFTWKQGVSKMVLGVNNCSCPEENPLIKVNWHPIYHAAFSEYLGTVFNESELSGLVRRKIKERKRLKQRAPPPAPVLFVDGKSPLSYPTQGLEVRPMKSVVIPGLRLDVSDKERKTFAVEIIARLGVLTTLADVPGVTVEGLGTAHLAISCDDLSHLNRQLQFIVYTNTYFDPDTMDYVDYRFAGFVGVIPVRIRYKTMLQAFDYVDDDIATKVTVVTKTFLRYHLLRQMIDSVRQFYPTITIIIADDSEHPQKVEGLNIEHYTMPYKKGWFAGRNLAISQVTTPYFLWVDDDFIFTSQTRIELLVQVIENSNMDIVGGVVHEELGFGNAFTQKISIEDGDELGDCFFKTKGYYRTVDGFPDCVVADVVINFFLGDTAKVRSVGFDPRLTRTGHQEFFLDGLGKLRVASCSHVSVGHTSKISFPWQENNNKLDKQYRTLRDQPNNANHKFLFYKFNLKCMHSD